MAFPKPGILVCGTKYGQSYLAMLAKYHSEFELKGIYSTGSERSLRLAKRYAVPAYTVLEEVPTGIGLVCVAVGGPPGISISKYFLEKNVPVIIEHPLAPGQINPCLEISAARKVFFAVNTHFKYFPAVAFFIEYARQRQSSSAQTSLEARINLRSLFSVLDILGSIFGHFGYFSLGGHIRNDSYLSLMATNGKINIHFLVSLYLQPDDKGSDMACTHNIKFIQPEAYLELLNPWGPAVESRTPSISHSEAHAKLHSIWFGQATSLDGYLRTTRLNANYQFVRQSVDAIRAGSHQLGDSAAYWGRLAEIWQSIVHLATAS